MNCPNDNFEMVRRHRINQQGIGIQYSYWHCELCSKDFNDKGNQIDNNGKKIKKEV